MSELKVYHHELRHNEYEEFYLKYEADKVIAELKTNLSEIQSQKMQLEDDVALLRRNNAELKESVKGLILDNYLKDKETRHHKYKRCLAMAEYWVAVSFHCVDDKHRQRAKKHHRKWLELADKFKECNNGLR